MKRLTQSMKLTAQYISIVFAAVATGCAVTALVTWEFVRAMWCVAVLGKTEGDLL
jgi:hypothetical protein